ncbi:ABC transporter substrate-binding protein [Microbacterium enclense]|uniref:Glycine betaine/proline transport system substrate-binding protein n=1 Tax=Microbacterium enclense TaxID=993073 RepID=A0A1G6MFI3_9MICO|nr:ABC transporter substrate-binding protein [Microbacterium enclense]KSU53764.1 glycine/betaine ABC transporter substrate-binding protein [Microbacterium enclense]SDC54388.1 glycine betaine/proline transport system substrate-binding protein [Microbacterium enclense]
MHHAPKRPVRTLAALVVISAGALTLAGCGSSLNDTAGGSDSAACGTTNLAMNNWVGYTADAAVYTYLAENELGCTVTQKTVSSEVAWQGFGSGEIDVVLENWGHEALKEKYIEGDKTAVEVGPTGNDGIIGWYIPEWMTTEYPDLKTWEDLNKYADLFATSESGGKGQLLDGDPSYVTNDEALVTNLGLNYQVVYAGSEAALIEAFRSAEANRTPLLAYFYEPHWFFTEQKLGHITLPEYTEGCDAVPEQVACDYPPYVLDKIASSTWVEKDTPAVKLLQNFTWTNDDQNTVAAYIAKDNMSPEDAAKKWVDDNPDKVSAMLEGLK